MSIAVYLCVVKNEMIVYKKYLGDAATSDSVKHLLRTGDLIPLDSWSEVGLTYEKYDAGDIKRNWENIVKSPSGLQNLEAVSIEGMWGLLYEQVT